MEADFYRDKKFRIIVGALWGVMLGFEIYKQLVFSFNNQTITWDYAWYSFPYQLCSTPLYLLPFVAFMKDCKLRDGIIIFISTFALFGGLCVYVFPNDVFSTDYLGVQIQTMVHHGLQLVLGVYIAVYYCKKVTLKNFLISIPVFAVLLVLALVLDLIVPSLVGETFNMFYISPYYGCHLPILSGIYQAVPYVVFLFIYTLGFVLCALLIFAIYFGAIMLAEKRTMKS